jgi:hypothetical protein
LSSDLFRELLRRVCREKNLVCAPEMEDYLTAGCAKHSSEGLRACFPRDVVAILCGIAGFEQKAPELTKDRVDQALAIYFGS